MDFRAEGLTAGAKLQNSFPLRLFSAFRGRKQYPRKSNMTSDTPRCDLSPDSRRSWFLLDAVPAGIQPALPEALPLRLPLPVRTDSAPIRHLHTDTMGGQGVPVASRDQTHSVGKDSLESGLQRPLAGCRDVAQSSLHS